MFRSDAEDDLGFDVPKRAAPKQRQQQRIFQEENFAGADVTRSVHIGWGATLGKCADALQWGWGGGFRGGAAAGASKQCVMD